jgi:hypothetical protein
LFCGRNFAFRLFAANFLRHASRYRLPVPEIMAILRTPLSFSSGLATHALPPWFLSCNPTQPMHWPSTRDKDKTPSFGFVQMPPKQKKSPFTPLSFSLARARPLLRAPICAFTTAPRRFRRKSFGSVNTTPASVANCESALAVG